MQKKNSCKHINKLHFIVSPTNLFSRFLVMSYKLFLDYDNVTYQ